jgi:hypothetical protein
LFAEIEEDFYVSAPIPEFLTLIKTLELRKIMLESEYIAMEESISTVGNEIGIYLKEDFIHKLKGDEQIVQKVEKIFEEKRELKRKEIELTNNVTRHQIEIAIKRYSDNSDFAENVSCPVKLIAFAF